MIELMRMPPSPNVSDALIKFMCFQASSNNLPRNHVFNRRMFGFDALEEQSVIPQKAFR